jgi:rhodanese-related sulfurtransferase
MTGIVFPQAFGSRRGGPTMNGLRIRKNSAQCLYEEVSMTRLEYFKARLDATSTPADVLRDMKSDPHRICVVDVRSGPASLLIDRIADALQITQSEILAQLGKLSKDRVLVLYCWDTWCDLAIQAAVPLLERGYDIKELFGGIRAWKTLQCPTEPADAAALARQSTPVRVIPL